MVGTMIVVPLSYEGPSYSVIQLKHDLSVWLSNHQTVKYTAELDWPNACFTCKLEAQDELAFILKHPEYQHYVQT